MFLKVRNITFLLILFSTVFSVSVSAAQTYKSALCDYCTTPQARQLALTTAGTATRYGITVYVADFSNEKLYKFFLLDDNPFSPSGEPVDFRGLLDERNGSPKIIDEQVLYRGDAQRSGVTIANITPTQAETKDFDELNWLVDILESHGIQTREPTRAGGPPAIFDWNVPSGFGFDSAFDVMDFVGRQRQLGNVAIAASPFIADAVSALSFSSNLVDLKPFLNLEFSYKFHFPDGSTGLFVFDNQGALQGVPGSWRDSELNDIPQNASDVPGMSSFFGSNESGSFNATRERILAFGFGVTVGGGGGGDCRFVCDAESCTVTCRTN